MFIVCFWCWLPIKHADVPVCQVRLPEAIPIAMDFPPASPGISRASCVQLYPTGQLGCALWLEIKKVDVIRIFIKNWTFKIGWLGPNWFSYGWKRLKAEMSLPFIWFHAHANILYVGPFVILRWSSQETVSGSSLISQIWGLTTPVSFTDLWGICFNLYRVLEKILPNTSMFCLTTGGYSTIKWWCNSSEQPPVKWCNYM